MPAATTIDRVLYTVDPNDNNELSETMKDPRKLTEKAENRAEELDERWKAQEEHVKQKYLDRFRVQPRYALLFDIGSILIGMYWILFYGLSANVGVTVAVWILLAFSGYSFTKNVLQVIA